MSYPLVTEETNRLGFTINSTFDAKATTLDSLKKKTLLITDGHFFNIFFFTVSDS